jgi:hypothetical protein
MQKIKEENVMPIPEVPKVPKVPSVPKVPKFPKYDGEEPYNSSTETEENPVDTPEASAYGSLNAVDWKKIGTGALLAAIGAGLTAAVEFLGGVDFGPWTGPIMAGVSIFANIVRKLLSGK